MKSKVILALSAVCALAIVARVVFASDGLPTLTRLRSERAHMEQLNADFEARNAALAAEIARVRAGGAALDAAARETLGYVRPDELVFRFTDAAARASDAPR